MTRARQPDGALPDAALPAGGWQTIGPFFPADLVGEADHDLTRLSATAAPTRRGEPVWLVGRVLEDGGAPCVNAVLEAWQADASGRFCHPHDPEAALADPDFLGWGRARTDADGWYRFRTVLPGGYRDAAGMRAPHVNLGILGSGIMRRLATTLFFPGFEAANAADPVLRAVPEPGLRALLVARPAGRIEGDRAFRLDLLLRGDAAEETPFFVD